MRRAALIMGVLLADVGAAAFARSRLRDHRPVAALPAEDAVFSVYAPGGRCGFTATGPVGWVLAAGTARLVLGNAAALPFGDGEFSAVTAIFAPAKHAEVFRVLHPGGRFVHADNDPRKSPSEPTYGWGRRRWTEADHRRMLEEAGFTGLTTRYVGNYLLVSGRKPAEQ